MSCIFSGSLPYFYFVLFNFCILCSLLVCSLNYYYSYSFISTTFDKTQLCHKAKIKWDGDSSEKKVNVIYKIINNQILELEQLHNTTSTCKISWKIASYVNNRWVDSNCVLDYNNYFWKVRTVLGINTVRPDQRQSIVGPAQWNLDITTFTLLNAARYRKVPLKLSCFPYNA